MKVEWSPPSSYQSFGKWLLSSFGYYHSRATRCEGFTVLGLQVRWLNRRVYR